eukprot:m.287837 g.287837  ORF g.287837 m.287837 type:complete len:666 (+) comp16368_c0_seq9:42-2039(+)
MMYPKVMTIIAMLCCGVDSESIVSNMNFTATSATTGSGALDWYGSSKIYQRQTEVVFDGAEAAMMYNNSDPSVYTTCTQSITDFVPGAVYQLSAFVKAVDIKGADSGATVCVEWSDKSGYIGGCYPNGVKGTTDWTNIKDICSVSDKATSLHISVYVRKGMSGMAYFDDIMLTRVPPGPPLSAIILSPAYRGMITATEPTLVSVMVLCKDELDYDYNTLQAVASIEDMSTGKTIESHTLTSKDIKVGGGTTLKFDINPQTGLKQGGKYAVIVRGMNTTTGAVVQEFQYNITRVVDSAPLPTVYIDKDMRLMVEGKPFFPLGLYAGNMNEDDFALFSNSSFNSVMPYDQMNLTQMNWAQKYGIKVAYTVKDDFCNHSLKCNETHNDVTVITEKIKSFKNHPATLMWYTNDELNLEWLPQLLQHQSLIQTLDWNHPTWSVLYEATELTSYINTFDTVGTDPYPIPTQPLSMVRTYANDTYSLTYGTKAIFEVIQAHNLKNYGHETGRTPTQAEARNMVWQAINHGANGIFFYSYFDIKRNPDVPFETEWARLNTVAKEVVHFESILLTAKVENPMVEADTANVSSWLSVRSHQLLDSNAKEYVVFACSDGAGTGKVTFSLPASISQTIEKVVDEGTTPPTTISSMQRSWSQQINKLDAHMYRVTLSN